MRQVTREPEKLELERQRQGISRGAALDLPPDRLEQVEKAHERVERLRVRIVLDEQAKHRLDADMADRDRVRIGRDVLI